MPEYYTILYDNDNPIPVTVAYYIEPAETGLKTSAEGWIEPPRGPNVIIESIVDEYGADRHHLLTDRAARNIERGILQKVRNP